MSINPTVDKRGGNLFPRQSVINTIEELQSELDLHDIWRIKNPTTRSYTWSQSEPQIFSRLDYWLISNSLADNVCSVDIIPSIKTDHSAILIEFQGVDAKAKGPGIWKLNCSLLSDETYVEKINSLIPKWVQEGENDLEDPRSVWDWVKYNIKKYSRKYSVDKCKEKKLEEQMLNEEFQEAYLIFENNPSQENQTTLNVLRERIEKLYEEKVEGIIVRSRARWHEHGEKNSKYFFNLEKRNHIKKHIRKLRLSGVITTDPFEILDAGKTFYENLYKSKRNSWQQNEQYFNFEDLPMPTLANDLTHKFWKGQNDSFIHRASKIWNSLPTKIKTAPSLAAFKASLVKNSKCIDSISFGCSATALLKTRMTLFIFNSFVHVFIF